MITVSTDVIQQSVRRDNFIKAKNNNNDYGNVNNHDHFSHYKKANNLNTKSNNKIRKISDSFDYPEQQDASHLAANNNNNNRYYNNNDDYSDNDLTDDEHEPSYYNKQVSYSATMNSSINNNKHAEDLLNFEKVELEQVLSPKVEKSGLALSFLSQEDDSQNGGISMMLNDNDDDKFQFPTNGYPQRHAAIPKGAGPPTNISSPRSRHHHNNKKRQQQNININLCIIFSEFDFSQEISVKIQIFDENMTVEQVINDTINKFENIHPLKKLRSYQGKDYELRCIDDDDLNEDDLDEDDLDPAMTRNAVIGQFVDNKNSQKSVFMVMCCTNQPTPHHSSSNVLQSKKSMRGVKFADTLDIGLTYSESREDSKDNDNDNYKVKDKDKDKLARIKRDRSKTMEEIEQQTKSVFIRIYIPGPINESSVVISIEKHETNTHSLRDMFALLNRKRKSHKFNSNYFDFYYRNKTKQYGAISNGIKLSDLIEKELIILPKILSSSDNEEEAFQFELVKLANQVKQFKCYKIARYQTKKKAMLLEIDRYRIVKTSLETSGIYNKTKNKNKTPIPIQDIISVIPVEKPNNGHYHNNNNHHNQFIITYSTPNKMNKTKTYEMNSNNDRDEIVSKLKFLCVIRRLQG